MKKPDFREDSYFCSFVGVGRAQRSNQTANIDHPLTNRFVPQVPLEHCVEHAGSFNLQACNHVTCTWMTQRRAASLHVGALSVLLSIVSNTFEAVTMPHPLGSHNGERHEVGQRKNGKDMQKRSSDCRVSSPANCSPLAHGRRRPAGSPFVGWLLDIT